MFPHSIQPIKLQPIAQNTHFSTKMCKIVKNVQISFILLLSVCVYVWKPAFKGLTIYSALFPFFSLFSGIWQNWVKLLYFLPN